MDSQVPNDNAIDFDLKERLLDKSIEAYVLALETINRLTIQYRCEAFCYLFCNAWELLLKSKILADASIDDAIFYKQKQGQPKRSLSLRGCLKRVFQNPNDPTRKNIERIEELRDEAVHLVISRIPSDIMGIFQAGVLNYHKLLNSWFGQSLSERYPLGMMNLVYDIGPDEWDITDKRLRGELDPNTAEFLVRFCADIMNDFDNLERPPEYSIRIEYRFTSTRGKDEADFSFSTGPRDGGLTKAVQVAKDSSVSHPYRQKELIRKLNSKIEGQTINQYDIQSINRIYRVKSRPEYFYQGKVKGSPGQYSVAFLEWLVRRHNNDSEFFSSARDRDRKERQGHKSLGS